MSYNERAIIKLEIDDSDAMQSLSDVEKRIQNMQKFLKTVNFNTAKTLGIDPSEVIKAKKELKELQKLAKEITKTQKPEVAVEIKVDNKEALKHINAVEKRIEKLHQFFEFSKSKIAKDLDLKPDSIARKKKELKELEAQLVNLKKVAGIELSIDVTQANNRLKKLKKEITKISEVFSKEIVITPKIKIAQNELTIVQNMMSKAFKSINDVEIVATLDTRLLEQSFKVLEARVSKLTNSVVDVLVSPSKPLKRIEANAEAKSDFLKQTETIEVKAEVVLPKEAVKNLEKEIAKTPITVEVEPKIVSARTEQRIKYLKKQIEGLTTFLSDKFEVTPAITTSRSELAEFEDQLQKLLAKTGHVTIKPEIEIEIEPIKPKEVKEVEAQIEKVLDIPAVEVKIEIANVKEAKIEAQKELNSTPPEIIISTVYKKRQPQSVKTQESPQESKNKNKNTIPTGLFKSSTAKYKPEKLDAANYEKLLADFQTRLKDLGVKINVAVDIPFEDVVSFQSKLDGIATEAVVLGIDDSDFKTTLSDLQAQINKMVLTVPLKVILDEKAYLGEIESLRARLNSLDFTVLEQKIVVRLNSFKVYKDIQFLKQQLKELTDYSSGIKIFVDTEKAHASLDDIEDRLRRLMNKVYPIQTSLDVSRFKADLKKATESLKASISVVGDDAGFHAYKPDAELPDFNKAQADLAKLSTNILPPAKETTPKNETKLMGDQLKNAVVALVQNLSNSVNKEKIIFGKPTNQPEYATSRGLATPKGKIQETTVQLRDDIGDRLQSGDFMRDDLRTLIHEIRHGMQNEAERRGKTVDYMLDPQNQTERDFVTRVQNQYEKDDRTQKREIDAHIFAERVVDAINKALGRDGFMSPEDSAPSIHGSIKKAEATKQIYQQLQTQVTPGSMPFNRLAQEIEAITIRIGAMQKQVINDAKSQKIAEIRAKAQKHKENFQKPSAEKSDDSTDNNLGSHPWRNVPPRPEPGHVPLSRDAQRLPPRPLPNHTPLSRNALNLPPRPLSTHNPLSRSEIATKQTQQSNVPARLFAELNRLADLPDEEVRKKLYALAREFGLTVKTLEGLRKGKFQDSQNKVGNVKAQQKAAKIKEAQLDTISQFATDVSQYAAPQISQAFDAASDLYRNLRRVAIETGSVSSAFKAIAAPVAFITTAAALSLILKNTIPLIDSFTRLEKNMSASGAGDFAKEMGRVKDIALSTGADIEGTAQQLAKFKSATANTSLKGQSGDIFGNVANYGGAIGASADEMQRAMNALQQMASKGKISLEELNGQLSEAIPGANAIAAKAMGLTNAQLYEMISSGSLLATEFLPKFSDELAKSAKVMESVGDKPLSQEFAILRNQIDLATAEGLAPFVGLLRDALGAVNNLTKGGNAFGVIMTGILVGLIGSMGISAVLMATNITLTFTWAGAFAFLGTAIATVFLPLAALTAALVLVSATIREIQLTSSDVFQVKSIETATERVKGLTDGLNESLEALTALNKAQQDKNSVDPLSASTGVSSNKLQGAREEYKKKGVFGQGISAIASSYKYATDGDYRGNLNNAVKESGFKNLKNPFETAYTLRGVEAEKEARAELLKETNKYIATYDQLIDKYGDGKVLESLTKEQTALDTKIKTTTDLIQLTQAAGDVAGTNTPAGKQALAANIADFSKGNPDVEIPVEIQNVTPGEAKKFLDNLVTDLTLSKEDGKKILAGLDPTLLDAVVQGYREQLVGLNKTDKEYLKIKAALTSVLRIQREQTALVVKQQKAVDKLNKSYQKALDLKADNKTKTELASKLADASLLSRALADGETDINSLSLERQKNQATAHAARMKQIKQERDAMKAVAKTVDRDSLQNLINITGNKGLRGKNNQLNPNAVTQSDIKILSLDQNKDKVSDPLLEYLKNYQSSQVDSASEFNDALIGFNEIQFAVRNEFAQADQELTDQANDIKTKYQDALKGLDNAIDGIVKGLDDTLKSLGRSIEDAKLDLKDAQNRLSTQQNKTSTTRALGGRPDTLIGRLLQNVSDVVDRQKAAITDDLSLTREALQINRAFDDGISGLDSVFDEYVNAFQDFQNQLKDISQQERKLAEDRAKQQKDKKKYSETQFVDSPYAADSVQSLLQLNTGFSNAIETNGYKDGAKAVDEAKKFGEDVKKLNAETAKQSGQLNTSNSSLSGINQGINNLPDKISIDIQDTIAAANSVGVDPLLPVVIEIRNALIHFLSGGGFGTSLSARATDPDAFTTTNSKGETQRHSKSKLLADTSQTESRLRDAAEQQTKYQKEYAEALNSQDKGEAAIDFGNTGETIKKLEQTLEKQQNALIGLGLMDEKDKQVSGTTAAKTVIADDVRVVSNKYGSMTTNRKGDDSHVVAPPSEKLAEQRGYKKDKYGRYTKYGANEAVDPSNNYSPVAGSATGKFEPIKTAVSEAVKETVKPLATQREKEVVTRIDQAKAGYTEVKKVQEQVLGINKQINASALENDELVAKQQREQQAIKDAENFEQSKTTFEKLDKRNNKTNEILDNPYIRDLESQIEENKAAINSFSAEVSTEGEVKAQRAEYKNKIAALDSSDLEGKKALEAELAGKEALNAQYATWLASLKTANVELEIQKTKFKELTDAQTLAEKTRTKVIKPRQDAISGRLNDRYIDQDERNNLLIEQKVNEQSMTVGTRTNERAATLVAEGLSNDDALSKAREEIALLDAAELDGLIDELDTVKNKMEEVAGSAIEGLFNIDFSDRSTSFTDKLLGMMNGIFRDLQAYTSKQLSGFLMDAIFPEDEIAKVDSTQLLKDVGKVSDAIGESGSEKQARTYNAAYYAQENLTKPKLETMEYLNPATDGSSGVDTTLLQMEKAGDEYKKTVAATVATQNQADNEAVASRVSNTKSNQTKTAGFISGGASLAGGIATGNKSAMGAGIGTIAGSFFGPAGGAIGGALGGLIGGLFYNGGYVGRMLRTEKKMSGKKPQLIVAHEGEQVLSTRNGDAEAFRAMQSNGVWGAMKNQMFYDGGQVGGSGATPLSSYFSNNNQKSNNQNNYFNISVSTKELVPVTANRLDTKKRDILG
jgi:tape measure domain-containing protein